MQQIKYDEKKQPYIDLGKGYKIRLEDEEVTDEKVLEKARIELREESEIQKEAISELKELINADKSFSFPHDDDFFYKIFLRPCHHYPKSAFEKLTKYFKFQIKHKKVCENLTTESIRHVLEDDLIKYYSIRDKNGCRVLYVHGGKLWKPSKVSLNDIFRSIQLSLEAAMLEPMSQINGVSVILDMEGLALSQIVHFTPMFAAMMLEWMQECVPVRIKGVYITNNSYIFNIVFKIFKPFIGAKLRQRIHFLGNDWEKLADFLGKKCLMKKFNGELDAEDVDGKLLADLLGMYSHRFEELNKGGFI
ncbi:hypothetical protein PVAND_016785 [Polypedilum vanderplanki]|uniref:CRAL-TRIO domain-containing protein n=1 Tax=Polypedilum vanderplanki TaxID=319348 RepID=A0A9J6BG59_POLVA|nr:hypothetical protein PVAND_016785 [Polypedilum vanderplanki]